ncbi:MAG: hypothetical protein JWQ23_2195 [Herminiimonas sp.]|nr:hypothetical protein [Herminiimonas sp.]
MSATRRGTRMSGMKGGFILEPALERSKAGDQALPDLFLSISHPGSFMYLDSIRLWQITKANISPVKPNSLKLTHALVEKL